MSRDDDGVMMMVNLNFQDVIRCIVFYIFSKSSQILIILLNFNSIQIIPFNSDMFSIYYHELIAQEQAR